MCSICVVLRMRVLLTKSRRVAQLPVRSQAIFRLFSVQIMNCAEHTVTQEFSKLGVRDMRGSCAHGAPGV